MNHNEDIKQNQKNSTSDRNEIFILNQEENTHKAQSKKGNITNITISFNNIESKVTQKNKNNQNEEDSKEKINPPPKSEKKNKEAKNNKTEEENSQNNSSESIIDNSLENETPSHNPSINESIMSYTTFKAVKEKQVKELLQSNTKLLEENTKFQMKITQLEQQVKDETTKNYNSNNDTTSKNILPSEIKETWEELAIQNIGDCFIDFFEKPVIVFHLVQEMFYIMKLIIEERKTYISNKILNLFDLSPENKHFDFIKTNLEKKFYEFLKDFQSDLFLNEETERVKNLNEYFKEQFLDFYLKYILPKLIEDQNENNISGDINDPYGMKEIINSRSFIKTIMNIKKILLYIEFHKDNLSFKINDFSTREVKYKSNETKDFEVLNVNGRSNEGQKKLILVEPPKLKGGYNFLGMLDIILPSNSNEEDIFKKETNEEETEDQKGIKYNLLHKETEKEKQIENIRNIMNDNIVAQKGSISNSPASIKNEKSEPFFTGIAKVRSISYQDLHCKKKYHSKSNTLEYDSVPKIKIKDCIINENVFHNINLNNLKDFNKYQEQDNSNEGILDTEVQNELNNLLVDIDKAGNTLNVPDKSRRKNLNLNDLELNNEYKNLRKKYSKSVYEPPSTSDNPIYHIENTNSNIKVKEVFKNKKVFSKTGGISELKNYKNFKGRGKKTQYIKKKSTENSKHETTSPLSTENNIQNELKNKSDRSKLLQKKKYGNSLGVKNARNAYNQVGTGSTNTIKGLNYNNANPQSNHSGSKNKNKNYISYNYQSQQRKGKDKVYTSTNNTNIKTQDSQHTRSLSKKLDAQSECKSIAFYPFYKRSFTNTINITNQEKRKTSSSSNKQNKNSTNTSTTNTVTTNCMSGVSIGNKKAKLYKIERQGNMVQLQQVGGKSGMAMNFIDIGSGNNKNISIIKNDETSYRSINKGDKIINCNPSIINSPCNINNDNKTNNKPNELSAVNKKSYASARKAIKQYTETLNFKKGYAYKGSSIMHSRTKSGNRPNANKSQDKNIIDFKTSANTKVNMDELINLKNKKNMMGLKNTFIQNGHSIKKLDMGQMNYD
ncbi:MAG: hypothetical protein MJ252_17505 [archaeon]|nr:hypothetical protein [archaeon]